MSCLDMTNELILTPWLVSAIKFIDGCILQQAIFVYFVKESIIAVNRSDLLMRLEHASVHKCMHAICKKTISVYRQINLDV